MGSNPELTIPKTLELSRSSFDTGRAPSLLPESVLAEASSDSLSSLNRSNAWDCMKISLVPSICSTTLSSSASSFSDSDFEGSGTVLEVSESLTEDGFFFDDSASERGLFRCDEFRESSLQWWL